MKTSTELAQESLNNLQRQCATGDAQAIITAAAEFSRAMGAMRAIELLSNALTHHENAVIFDVGANEGFMSETYRQLFPTAIIHAFEPHPQAFAQLQRKFSIDANVIINNLGVADLPGQLQFNLANQSASSSFIPFSDQSPYVPGTGLNTVESLEVAVTSIDNYCIENDINYIDYIKLDVQGFESKVLAGAANMLNRNSIGIIQTEIIFRDFYQSAASFFDIEQHLIKHGFTLRCIYDIYPAEGAQIFQCDAIYSRL